MDELSSELAAAESEMAELKADAGMKAQLDATNEELQLLRKKVKVRGRLGYRVFPCISLLHV